MLLSEAIMKRIDQLSTEHKMPIAKWSIKAGINPSTLYSLTRRELNCPKIQTIKLLCEAIDISLADFFDVDYIKTSENQDF